MNKLKLILLAVGAGIALVWAMLMNSVDDGIDKANESIDKSKEKIKDIQKVVKDEKRKNNVSGQSLSDRANRTRRR